MGETVPKEEYDKLQEWYSEQLLRKDKEIERLSKENKLLLKSALKQAELNLPKETQS